MWDNAIIFGVEIFIGILIYASLKLNKDAARFLGVFLFISALYLQQWAFVLMIDIAADAGKTAIADSLGKLYGNYPLLLQIVMFYYIFLIGLEIFELYTGYNVAEELKMRLRKKDAYGRIYHDNNR